MTRKEQYFIVRQMMLRIFGTMVVLLFVVVSATTAPVQKAGGILKLWHFDSPASMSILEEATRATVQPMMGVFNNLVLYDQHIARWPAP
jgi:peptide/nickel transport system substrate-binding protein